MKQKNTSVALLIAAFVMVTCSVMANGGPPNGGPPSVPDASSTSVLLAGSLMGLAAAKRWIWR
jgi:hypothetical protein